MQCEMFPLWAERGFSQVSKSVAELCAARELTIEGLVERTGLMRDRIMAIVLGRWTPSPSERASVAAALDVPPGEIAWGHKTPIQHIYGHGPG
jgi:transcriptional regulator with XRE-family HTH domain